MAHKVWIAQPKEKRNQKKKPWEVKREKADRASKDFKTREKAWRYARKLAKEHGTKPHPATAKLKKRRNGEFTETVTHPRKRDRTDRRM